MRSSTTTCGHFSSIYQHVYLMYKCYPDRPPAAEPCARLLPPLSRRSRAQGNQSPETIIKSNLRFFLQLLMLSSIQLTTGRSPFDIGWMQSRTSGPAKTIVNIQSPPRIHLHNDYKEEKNGG